MNQQRSRRFRTAKDKSERVQKWINSGKTVSDKLKDSNMITPGTEFMFELNHRLKEFVRKQIADDLLWRKCKVVVSGSDVPGEGEHKIIE